MWTNRNTVGPTPNAEKTTLTSIYHLCFNPSSPNIMINLGLNANFVYYTRPERRFWIMGGMIVVLHGQKVIQDHFRVVHVHLVLLTSNMSYKYIRFLPLPGSVRGRTSDHVYADLIQGTNMLML